MRNLVHNISNGMWRRGEPWANLRPGTPLIVTVLLFLFSTSFISAQFRPAIEVIVVDALSSPPKELRNAWAGGLVLPQFSAFDLNQDGFEDLVVFDKSAGVFLCFLHEGLPGSTQYTYAPRYESAFPQRSDWALLRDYNNDGLPDLFSYTSAGFGVWKASWDAETEMPVFTLINEQVRYLNGALRSPIFTSRADLPAFADINGDGDIDVITFGTFGGFVRYFENLSVENGWDPDSLLFDFASPCWGDWFEGPNCNGGELNISCFGDGDGERTALLSLEPGQYADDPADFQESLRAHAGSAISALDKNGDGLMDMLLGDAGCSNLVLAYNGGSIADALVVEQDTFFPRGQVPVNFPAFLGSFLLDVDQDGKDDLLIAPNDITEGRNASNVWYYRNESADSIAPVFVQEDFLVQSMLDEGAESKVHIADLNGDGLPDILIGRLYLRDDNGAEQYGLSYLRNTGTPELAAFERVSTDFGALSALGRSGLAPATADLDGDGDLDLLVGDSGGNLHFYRNIAAPGEEAIFELAEMNFQGINLGVQAVPYLYDVDGDGRIDLILGERNGNLNYLRNTGTTLVPIFALQSEFWGEVDTRRPGLGIGSSAPFLHQDASGQTELYVGSQSGYIYRYSGIDGNLGGAFTLLDSAFGALMPGWKSSVALADFNGDTLPDLLLGSARGGLQLWTQKDVPQVSGLTQYSPYTRELQIWPNPARDHLFISRFDASGNGAGSMNLQQPVLWRLHSAAGGIAANGELDSAWPVSNAQLKLPTLPPGLYLLELLHEHQRFTAKVFIAPF